MAPQVLAPDSLDALRDAVAEAAARGTPLAVEGAGTKRGLGHAVAANATLSLARLAGITYYEPGELVMEAFAGTPLSVIEGRLAANGQRLAFEPGAIGHLWGAAAGAGTIGGAFACNLSGPRRPFAGAARDHLLGIVAVSGRGEVFSAGGRVVKNVTGYDMGKLLAGSFGTLAVMGRVTFKVMPAPAAERTVLLMGAGPRAGLAALVRAADGPWDISGAAHLPAAAAARSTVASVTEAGAAVAAIRLEGAEGAVAERATALRAALSDLGPTEELDSDPSRLFWAELRDARLIAPAADPAAMLWRLTLPPAAATDALDVFGAREGSEAICEWLGGLVWLALAGGDSVADAVAASAELREAVTGLGGHAVLWRAAEDIRARVPVFGTEAPALAALTRRIKANFDPRGILNPGRLGPGRMAPMGPEPPSAAAPIMPRTPSRDAANLEEGGSAAEAAT